jgi:pyrroloquinoline quinone (PQQ) biosynthesis protein C
MSRSVGSYIKDQLLASSATPDWSSSEIEWVRKTAEKTAADAYGGDRSAAEELHRTAYRIFVERYRAPWDPDLSDVSSPVFATFLWVFGREWDRAERRRCAATIEESPAEPAAYAAWVRDLVAHSRCSSVHPLFEFFANEATYEQLREYIRQDTPQDLFFADVLTSLFPGVYGEPRMEMADNFWDETGCGEPARVHRSLRLELMRHLELPEDDARDPDRYVLEEIEQANAYFLGASDRSRALVLIGMLLATESLAPGRLQKQIDGWRRVGLDDSEMTYLLEHTVVDVEHGDHWMERVVLPIVREEPNAMTPITLGVLRRLNLAERVCDAMLGHLVELEPVSS